MTTRVHAVDRPELPPFVMPDRFRHEVAYFMSIPGEQGVPQLPAGEYWVRLEEAQTWYDEGVFRLVSPLDSENRTEVELSEEQEDWLAWMIANRVQRLRVE